MSIKKYRTSLDSRKDNGFDPVIMSKNNSILRINKLIDSYSDRIRVNYSATWNDWDANKNGNDKIELSRIEVYHNFGSPTKWMSKIIESKFRRTNVSPALVNMYKGDFTYSIQKKLDKLVVPNYLKNDYEYYFECAISELMRNIEGSNNDHEDLINTLNKYYNEADSGDEYGDLFIIAINKTKEKYEVLNHIDAEKLGSIINNANKYFDNGFTNTEEYYFYSSLNICKKIKIFLDTTLEIINTINNELKRPRGKLI